MEEQKHIMYNQATMIASFVGCVLNGKHIPSYDSVFPSEEQGMNVDMLKEAMLDFAEEANKRRKE